MNYVQPLNATLKDAEIVRSAGRLLTMDGSTNTLETTDVTDVCIGVAVEESSRDSLQVYETTGATVSYYPLTGILLVQVDAASTFNIGDTVYVGGAGLATSTAGSNKKLGLYVGESAHAATALSAPLGGNDGQSGATEGALIRVNTSHAQIA
jgi:hypothetical protein